MGNGHFYIDLLDRSLGFGHPDLLFLCPFSDLDLEISPNKISHESSGVLQDADYSASPPASLIYSECSNIRTGGDDIVKKKHFQRAFTGAFHLGSDSESRYG